jgi:type II secretory pathway component PulF
MGTWFPTFRRMFGFGPPIAAPWPWRATRAQRRSLLRLIEVATEENLPLSRLVESWAQDESGRQRHRLDRLADRLRAGAPLPDAIEEVRGVLGDEDILAIRFGTQSGTLAGVIHDTLERPDPTSLIRSRRWRHLSVYVCLMVLVGIGIVTFLQVKIIPQFQQIFREFDVTPPTSFTWSNFLAKLIADYWYLFALTIIAAWLLAFSSSARRLRLMVLGRLIRPLRELRMADVLQKLSVATQAGRPISAALSTLARYHFDPTLRHQLLFIRNEMEQGADIWQSMAKLGLLTAPETQALETAERVGNQPWVLNQLALVKKRQTMRRLTYWSELALPIVVVVLGSFVLLQSVSILDSLVHIDFSLL